jgi:glucokinase
VAERAVTRVDARFAEVFDIFCEALGCAAGNLALTLGARSGIYIGGGIVPRWGEAFVHSSFRAAFEAKGRLATYLSAIPVYVVQAPLPALTGAAMALTQSGAH